MSLRAPAQTNLDPDDEEPGFFAEVNITPLTDVILVLLIIFMVSSSAMVDAAREGRLDVELPQAGIGATTGSEAKTIVVSVLRDGRVALDDDIVAEEQLVETLRARLKQDPALKLIIDADGDLAHKKVVHVLDLAREAGFPDVGIGVAPGAP